MTQITDFGRSEHALVSSRVKIALRALESELGVKFSTGGGTIGRGGGVTGLVEDAVVREPGR